MPDNATADFFQPRSEQGTLWGNSTKHLPEPRVELPACKIGAKDRPLVDNWPVEAAEIAAAHRERAEKWDEPPCECGACRFTNGRK